MSAPTPRHVPLDADVHASYRALIESRFGLRLTDHQARELDQRVAGVQALTDFVDAEALWRAFGAGWRPDLLQTLVAELTIGETHFFRIEPQIAALREFILPDLIRRNATSSRSLRLWSAGCSTGEEPFTLAMLVDELLPRTAGWNVDIVATDLNAAALETARQAVYGEWSFRGTSDALRERYFVPEGTRWRLVEAVRRMVQFTNHNLVEDTGPGGVFDLILCRNVAIYFSPEATRRAYQTLAKSLTPRGWLILGASDPTPGLIALLEPVYLPGVVCWRRLGERVRVEPEPPARAFAPTPRSAVPAVPAVRERIEIAQLPPHVGDRASAMAQAERAAAGQPTSATAHLMLGMLCLDDGGIEAALTSLRRATFLDPNDPLAHFSLGRAWLLSGNRQRARASFLDARRQLVGMSVDAIVPGGGGTWASELRHAIEAQLEALRNETAA